MHLFLTFSAALGIARTSSPLHSLARKLAFWKNLLFPNKKRRFRAQGFQPVAQFLGPPVAASVEPLPKRGTVVEMHRVRQFVQHHVVREFHGQQRQGDGEADAALRRATAPAR